jgi:two-component system, chemotaxis family, protein-glutamate methylesterase/glutaminase
MTSKISVLIVDDSAFYRGLLERVLGVDPEIEVVAVASDPLDAREKIKQFNPDVITLDVEMPNMDGISFLEKIMRLRPMPVIMVSTLTQTGTDITLRALEIGAVDCHPKPQAFSPQQFEAEAGVLREKVKVAARARVRTFTDREIKPGKSAPSIEVPENYSPIGHFLTVGASTGGVEALLDLLSGLPGNCPPTVITQHMPETFTRSFANRLDKLVAPNVHEAEGGEILAPGHVYIAPGGNRHMVVNRVLQGWQIQLIDGSLESGHRPSVDMLFRSVAKNVGKRAIGVILTGMGRDGADGLKQIRDAGGRTIGQNEATCVVYGMPRAAYELGGVETQLALKAIPNQILALCKKP